MLRHQGAEVNVARQHDMAGAHARVRRRDPLAHALDVDRERARVLEDARAAQLRRRRQPERVIERMDVKGARQMQRVEIMVGLEHLAHALGRPALDLVPELLTVELEIGHHLIAVVGLRHFEPAADRIDARHAGVADRAAHIFEAAFRERPQRLSVIDADPAHDPVHRLGEAGQHEAVVAPGRVPGDALGLQHRDRPAAARDLACDGQAGQPAADHADLDVEIEGECAALGSRHHGRGVPARRVARPLGRVHVFFPAGSGRRQPPQDMLNWDAREIDAVATCA